VTEKEHALSDRVERIRAMGNRQWPPLAMSDVGDERLLYYGKQLAVQVYEELVRADASAASMTDAALLETVFVELIRRCTGRCPT
jgi:hypothetical protein